MIDYIRIVATILPDMTLDEAHEITKIHSISGLMPSGKEQGGSPKGIRRSEERWLSGAVSLGS
jgi:hypothetical protein